MTSALPAIECNDLGKRYFLRNNEANPLKRLRHHLFPGFTKDHQHRALQNVSFSIGAGESVAIVGVNGSGKSTLLKLISGITCASSGSLMVRGRVGGILDLGAGFHHDLTGYENIFLQASLLGLSRQETLSRLNEIEDFCELGKFLNSPVRHYSMGMFLRLGFAIAIHTDPEIVVIDEAMAVGDGYFMAKCVAKLGELKAKGKTLIYVSHVAEQVETLCTRALWLHEGQLRADGPIGEVMHEYHQFQFADILEGDPQRVRPELSAMIPYSRFGTGEVTMQNVHILDSAGRRTRYFKPGEPLVVELDAIAKTDVPEASLYFILERPNRSVTYADSSQRGKIYGLTEGANRLRLRVPSLPLRPGPYTLTLGIGKTGNPNTMFDAHQKIYTFTILPSDDGTPALFSGFLNTPTTISQV